jgi:hypothetical protein
MPAAYQKSDTLPMRGSHGFDTFFDTLIPWNRAGAYQDGIKKNRRKVLWYNKLPA